MPVKLMLEIGRKAIIETARVRHQGELAAIASLPLGTNAVTLLDLTTGYATFANGGKLAIRMRVLEIRRPTGDILYSREDNAAMPRQVRAGGKDRRAEFDADRRGQDRHRPPG